MMTASPETVVAEVRAALRGERRLGLHAARSTSRSPMAGEVASVAAKKLALERAAALPAVTGIVDRLRVRPAERQGGGAIRDHLRDALLQEPAFGELAIVERQGEQVTPVRASPIDTCGTIECEVDNGVVTLNGKIPGLDDKRLAGVLAWWVPGSRDVINGLAVEPPEADSDAAIAEAVRLALEKDPFANAGRIRVGVRQAAVTLTELVPSEAERECDLFGDRSVLGRCGARRCSISRIRPR